MSLQVLVAAMHQKDHSLPEKMNIQSDVIVANQCDWDSIERFTRQGHEVIYLNRNQRGVGLNRNQALLQATADICLIADEDVVYYDGYAKSVEDAYRRHPDADVIIFDMRILTNEGEISNIIKREEFVGKKALARYGTVRISFRTESIKRKNIYFHRMFGGGTPHSNGEDTIFLSDCADRGLKVLTCPVTLGEVHNYSSTWFQGYDDKYFYDRGVLFAYLHPVIAKPLCLYHVVKHRRKYGSYGIKQAILKMWEGCSHRL